jgi:DNA invertase Pin-like site-specific DNA recombinase
MMRTAVAYLRTATMDADGLSRQRQIIGAWAEREQIAIVAYHVDAGICGQSAPRKRAGLAAALAAVQRDRLLVVASPDRISRRLVQVARVAASLARRGSALACPLLDLSRWLPILLHIESAAALPAER